MGTKELCRITLDFPGKRRVWKTSGKSSRFGCLGGFIPKIQRWGRIPALLLPHSRGSEGCKALENSWEFFSPRSKSPEGKIRNPNPGFSGSCPFPRFSRDFPQSGDPGVKFSSFPRNSTLFSQDKPHFWEKVPGSSSHSPAQIPARRNPRDSHGWRQIPVPSWNWEGFFWIVPCPAGCTGNPQGRGIIPDFSAGFGIWEAWEGEDQAGMAWWDLGTKGEGIVPK